MVTLAVQSVSLLFCFFSSSSSLSLSLRAIRQFTSFSLGFSAVICCLNVQPKKKRKRKKCVVFTQRRGGKRERQPLSNSTLILSVLDCALKRKKSVLFTSVHKVIINQAGNARGTLPVPLRRDWNVAWSSNFRLFFFQVSRTFKANRGARRLWHSGCTLSRVVRISLLKWGNNCSIWELPRYAWEVGMVSRGAAERSRSLWGPCAIISRLLYLCFQMWMTNELQKGLFFFQATASKPPSPEEYRWVVGLFERLWRVGKNSGFARTGNSSEQRAWRQWKDLISGGGFELQAKQGQ